MCNESADQSHCCGANDYCLDNGLCYDFTGTISQAGCTDPDWTSSSCFQFCKSADSPLPITATGFYVSVQAGIRKFCCDIGTYNSSLDKCTYGDRITEPFTFDYGRVITDRSTGSTELFNSTHTQQSNSTEVAGAQTITVTATATATAAGNSSSSGGDSTGKEAAIGAGIGAPLLLALMVVSYLLHREKKKLKAYEAAGGLALGEGKGQYSQQPPYPPYGYPNESAINYQHGVPSEIGESRIGELDGTTRAQELEHKK